MPLDDRPNSTRVEVRQDELAASLAATRKLSLEIAAPLSAEDQVVQAHDDASPAKWHLAHTTWFFEELILKEFLPDYRVFDPQFAYCFNSYYESLGPRHPRPRRGLLTRPSAEEVRTYRSYADEHLEALLNRPLPDAALNLIRIGINHEQQHQELMLTDILALFASNPLRPVYADGPTVSQLSEKAAGGYWREFEGGIYDIGHDGEGFAYDNEGPRHQVLLRDFKLFSREVTNEEWIAFIEDGGYSEPTLWLSDGWAALQREQWQAPGYWELLDGVWHQMTLHGLCPVEMNRPVTHISYYEADAYARWAGERLPTEFEWETAAQSEKVRDLFDLSDLAAEPAASNGDSPFFCNLWQWTQSAYLPYPGYKPAPGPLGEYNGKFMCNQFVLRGGSFATPNGHIRPSYRNFFYPHQRWQFMGLRLAGGAS
ncbi:MAG: ergothioneine biosynthesis protein EgtB [Rhodomicrobium sp.]